MTPNGAQILISTLLDAGVEQRADQDLGTVGGHLRGQGFVIRRGAIMS
jgi:hypothetical protein